MGLLYSEAGKRRLLSVEIPVIERYNEGREPAYKIQVSRLGGSLVLEKSEPGKGSLFALELSAHRDAAPNGAHPPAPLTIESPGLE